MWKCTLVLLCVNCLAFLQAEEAKKEFPISTPFQEPLTPNNWVKVERHGAARRSSGAVLYLPKEHSFLHCLGVLGAWNDQKPTPYDELTFTMDSRIWENRFPPGKTWGPKIGVCSAPVIRGTGFRIKDSEGNARLGLSQGGFSAYKQVAYDFDRNKVVAFLHNRTLEYDPVSRVWAELKTVGNPMEGTDSWFGKLWWGTLCYDGHNKEFILFGGNNGTSEYNDTRTWIFSPEKLEWRRLQINSVLIPDLQKKAVALKIQAIQLQGAYTNRFYKTELLEIETQALTVFSKKLLTSCESLMKEIAGKGTGYEKVQCDRAVVELDAAIKLCAALGDTADANAVRATHRIVQLCERMEDALMCEPPPRAYAPMVYDPKSKKIVLFGGDRLDMLYGDTWIYDCVTRTWEERRPAINPAPRAGHALVWLPKSGAVVALGGYAYDSKTSYAGALYKGLPMQTWHYDIPANTWNLIKDCGTHEPVHVDGRGGNCVAAADANDVVVCLGTEYIKETQLHTVCTYACQMDIKAQDKAGESKLAVKANSVEWRKGPYEPDWFSEDAVPAEAAFQAKLQAIPTNTWTTLTDKGSRLPKQNRDWGTAVYDSDRQTIYRWSGGHSAHCGTDIPVFSLRTGLYHIKYPPAFPIENIGACASQPSISDFQGHPWIAGHSYRSYSYDVVSKKMVCVGHALNSFEYDPSCGLWSHKPLPKGTMRYSNNFYTLILCSTQEGVFAWTATGTIFKYDGLKNEWTEVQVGGEKLVGTSCDVVSMCYDSKRHRLLLIHSELKGDLFEVDLKTLTAKRLSPKGMASTSEAGMLWRECCYDTANDAMVMAIRDKDKLWAVYDCARNMWIEAKISNSPGFTCSNALMYDPQRKLVLAVDTNSVVYALKLDLSGSKELK